MKPITVTAYRGQHGARTAGAMLQSQLPTITFCTLDAAIVYARSPNNPGDRAVDPHVVKANLVINKPLPIDPEDPFIDVSLVLDIMGRSAGKAFCLEHADWIIGTNNWEENFEDDFDSVAEVFERAPKRVAELYFNAYIALDDAAFVKAAVAKGYDGCAHGGNGESALMTEYKVFKADQIRVEDIMELDAACDLRDKMNAQERETYPPVRVPEASHSTGSALSP